ncbi:MAG: ABC transporter substrate-binding protein [Planctomycetes bacterium]|nr:ABC transporter substrate-binding protein [Planctomycetota bacterium]
MIYVGIDDTDTLETQGTNQLARALVRRLGVRADDAMILRHQLLFDPRVPYTSHNGSASILLKSLTTDSIEHVADLIDELRHGVQSWYVHGSDPGLCVASEVPSEVIEFGRRCQRDLMTQEDARCLAARYRIHLEGLGGTEQGVIGALAAVGLAAGADDGRLVHATAWPWPDDLTGPQDVGAIWARGIEEIRCIATGQLVTDGIVDVCKRLRPNRRGGRIVLYVSPAPDSWPAPPFWHAVRLP